MNDPLIPPRAERTHHTDRSDRVDRRKLDQYFRLSALVVLLLLGAVATLRAYLAIENAIITWLRPQFVAVAQAAFSVVVLALVVWLIRAWIIARAPDE